VTHAARRVLNGTGLGLGAAALALLVGALPWVGPFVETVELKTFDRRMRLTADPTSASRDIVLIEINETSLRALEPVAGRWPWPRVVHSSVIDFLARAGARVIAYDVQFGERDRRTGFPYGDATWSGAESDAALVEAVRASGRVITIADVTYEGVAEGGDVPPDEALEATGYDPGAGFEARPAARPPFADLAAASLAVGHSGFVLDADGPVRWTLPFVRVGGQALPALGIATALAAAGIRRGEVGLDGDRLLMGRVAMPLVARPVPSFGAAPPGLAGRALVNYRGPAVLDDGVSRPYASYAFYDVLYSEEQVLAGEAPDLDPARFRDKVVFVGVTASGLADTFPTPFGDTGRMPGIQVHASVTDSVLSGRFIRPAGAGARVATVVAVALLVGLAGALLSVPWAVVAAAAVTVVFLGAAVQLFANGVWLSMVEPVLAIGLSLFGGVSYQYFVEGREKRRVKALFGRFVSPDVYGRLLDDPALARLGGSRREMTVLFSDIRGFTTATEVAEPEALVTQLNEHFSRMVQVLFKHRGTVDKFVGDMVMALFGAPLDDPDHADHAVAAALDMAAALGDLNRHWTAAGRPPFDIGIGINSGEMIAGNIGSERIMSYTVIGDAVNLGARLESLNKEYGTRIIISEATRTRLKGRYDLRPLGEVVVKGKTQAVGIFEVVAGAAPDGAGRERGAS
jgi:adenylate cyclase